MKFGVHSYMIVDEISPQTIDEMARTAAAWGADGVEVHLDRAESLPRGELNRAAALHGVEWTLGIVLTPGNSLASPDPAIRQAGVQHITEALHAAADIGARSIGGVLSAASRVFSGRPVTADELQWVAEGLFEESSVPRGILDAGERLGYVQIAESHRGSLGSGHIPWPEVMAALRAVGYDGWLTFEAFTPAHAQIAAKSNTWRHLCTEEAMVTEGIHYLRGLT